MNSSPPLDSPPPPSVEPPNEISDFPPPTPGGPWRLAAWIGLVALLSAELVQPFFAALLFILDNKLNDTELEVFWPSVAAAIGVTALVSFLGWRRGHVTDRLLIGGWMGAGCMAALVAFVIWPAFAKARRTSQDGAVLGNARQLAAAADQYYLENGVSTARYSELVGNKNYIRGITLVTKETYPIRFTQGVTITVSGVAGTRIVTYSP